MSAIVESTWHGFPAIRLESERMQAVIVPELGAKIVSLFDRLHNYEWLVPPVRPLRRVPYGADFVSQDMSGWDEMMPTIIACRVDGFQYPDHGEVWSIPWRVETGAGAVVGSVEGVARPYAFSRSAALTAPDCLELGYTMKNTGEAALAYLWAAHPQFLAEAATRIVLPPEVTQMVNVVEDDPAWGPAGEIRAWPTAKAIDGQLRQMDRVRSTDHHACRKFYIPPDQHVAWAALVNEGLGCQFRMSWSPQELPYLGLWIDEGTYNSLPVAAPEPSNGYYDSLERAIQNRRVTILEPGEEKSWKLRVQLGGG